MSELYLKSLRVILLDIFVIGSNGACFPCICVTFYCELILSLYYLAWVEASSLQSWSVFISASLLDTLTWDHFNQILHFIFFFLSTGKLIFCLSENAFIIWEVLKPLRTTEIINLDLKSTQAYKLLGEASIHSEA